MGATVEEVGTHHQQRAAGQGLTAFVDVTSASDTTAETHPFAAWIGLYWADQKHFWSSSRADGKLQRGQPDNTPEAIEVWAVELARRFGGRPVRVALGQSRGGVIGMLANYPDATPRPTPRP